MVTREQVVQQVFERLISPATCDDCAAIEDMDCTKVVKTATGLYTVSDKCHTIAFFEDGTAITVIDGIEYKLKMIVEIVSERKVEEEYARAESPKQLVYICKAANHEVQVSEMTAQSHLKEFNEGMAALESENRSVLDVDLWIADFVSKIGGK
ncbi:MAG: hypothetical protein WC919_06970 [Candidatus Paceibacterota bacterium]|jgi:hypothetical protein